MPHFVVEPKPISETDKNNIAKGQKATAPTASEIIKIKTAIARIVITPYLMP